ncbi:MAG: hypothetical protein AAF433_03225 [Bacteroidota bacterium]
MQILTVVVGMIFVLLLLSLLATTLMELIASFFSLRGKNLLKALRNMLASDDEQEVILSEFQNNSLYRHLTQQYGRKVSGPPSYINAETFQSILFDVILKDADYQQLPEKINQLPDDDLRNVLQQLLRESDGQLDLFRLEVQNWYNNVMDRAAGWYKRNTQKILVLMGLGIAILFNADTVSMYENLSIDRELANRLYQNAVIFVDNQDLQEQAARTTTTLPQDPAMNGNAETGPSFEYQTVPLDSTAETTVNPIITTVPANSTTIAPAEVQVQINRDSIVQELQFIKDELMEISSPLGLGWEGVDVRQMSFYDLFTKLLGFILTALAISMGAPFWFDLLRKLVNIRSAGNKP